MAKELLQPNMVEAPTLFVGVGGTGCKIVKAVAEMCHPQEKENINFVCLDTNVNDLSAVKASKSNIYYVQTSNTQTVGDYLNYDRDALKNWFPKSSVIYDKTVSEGAGQVRAISRLALNATIKTGRMMRLYDAIDNLFRKDGQELKQALRVVMVSTASGGTGSGMILPLSMVIRDYVSHKYPNTSMLIRGMILLPETLDSVIKSNVERESQRRNAYATIKEINAFMMKGSGFLDVDENLRRFSGLHVDVTEQGSSELKSLSVLPFDFCFLMDGQNAEDSTLTSISQYIKQAALALYEQNIGPMMKDAFSMEDNIIKEMSNPGNYGRNRFGGIGAGAIRYPYEDVADYVAYDWAIDTMGGEGEAGKWIRYDRKFDIKQQEERKQGVPSTERTRICDFYVDSMDKDDDKFFKAIRNIYLQDAEEEIDEYFKALKLEMEKCMSDNVVIRAAWNAAKVLGNQMDYAPESGNRGNATSNLSKLRVFEAAVKDNVVRPSKNRAEAIFQNENKTINANRDNLTYTLEYLLTNKTNGVMHPNAMRYILYILQNRFAEKRNDAINAVKRSESTLDNFRQGVDKVEFFSTDPGKDTRIKSIDDLCAAEQEGNGKQNDRLYEKLNELFPSWYRAIESYGKAKAVQQAYEFGYEYVKELSEEFESFYHGFKQKVRLLERRQEDLVDSMRFSDGDSVMNVCSTKEMLHELSLSTGNAKSESTGESLDSELCAMIFDAVKSNVAFQRDVRSSDVVEEDRSVDVFDDILLGYFMRSVRMKCKELDMNIIEAIAKEKHLLSRIEARKDLAQGEKVVDRVTIQDCKNHILSVIETGKRLSAPSIQRPRNEEPREIELVAYNEKLNDMRNYSMSELIPGGRAVDTVSKYELHYFNALYNLTPNKLDKFSARVSTETRKKSAGLYHEAYWKYARNIGPDSTRNASISTHIDKRWDSISVMPEIDLDFQEKQTTRIQQALIYAVLYEKVRRTDISTQSKGKKVYRYTGSMDQTMEMIVSNGTLCDEFYEILDAFYINPAIVGDMDLVCKKNRERDSFRNSAYSKTEFAKAAANLRLGMLHKGIEDCRKDEENPRADKPASLFEIPIAYYNSLPNSQFNSAEVASLVDAVIKTIKDEARRWEKADDAKFLVCDVLDKQFKLFAENYEANPEISKNLPIKDNPVVEIIYRKIRAAIEETPEPDDYEEELDEIRRYIGR